MSLSDFEYARVEGDLILYGMKTGEPCPLRLVVPEGVTVIGEAAFQGAWIEELVLPKSLKIICNRAFAECSDLTEIEVAAGCELSQVGSGAFSGCDALNLTSLPIKKTSAADSLRKSTPRKESVSAKSSNSEGKTFTPLSKLITEPYEDGLLLVKPAVTDLDELILPPEIVAIGHKAFFGNNRLRRFKAGESLKIILNEAFRGCSALYDVSYDIHTAVSEQAFRGCPFTTANVTPIVYGGAFWESKVKRVKFKNLEWGELHEIPNNLLSHTSIESIDLPDSVWMIGHHAFSHCKSLKRVSLPNTVSYMGNGVFEDCSELKEFTMPKGVGGVPARCFAFCDDLERVSISDQPGQIGEMAFYGCNSLRELRIPKNVYCIGNSAVLSASLERVILEGKTFDEVRRTLGFQWLLTGGRKVDVVCTDRTYTMD